MVTCSIAFCATYLNASRVTVRPFEITIPFTRRGASDSLKPRKAEMPPRSDAAPGYESARRNGARRHPADRSARARHLHATGRVPSSSPPAAGTVMLRAKTGSGNARSINAARCPPDRGAGRGRPRCGRRRRRGSPCRWPWGAGPLPRRLRPGRRRPRRPSRLGRPGLAGAMGAEGLKPPLTRPRRQAVPQRPAALRALAAAPARSSKSPRARPRAAETPGQVAAIRGDRRDVLDQCLADRDGPIAGNAGLSRSP